MENLGNNVNTPNSGNGVASVPQDQTQPQVETSAHASGVVQPPVSTQVLTQTQNQPQIQTLSQAVLPTPVPQAPPQTVAQQAGLVQVPSTQNQMVKNIILGIFAVLSLGYCAYFFSTNQPTFFSKSHTSPSFEKLSIGSVLNRDVIKDRWSLVVVNAKEGILKDKKDVYRCDPLGGAYAACIVQVAVKNPQSFERVTNIFGKDSELVYVLDGNTNNYKVLKEASAPTFRPLYNGMTESLMGLYAGDDFHLFKGEKILTIKSVPTGMNDALFYKEYTAGEEDPKDRPRYSRMAQGFDGDIQYMADGEFMYHGDGKASSTDPYIHLTKVEGSDLKSFTYYQQKLMGTSYLKYAYDKNNIYCDNATLDKDKYFTSSGLTVIKDPNPKSLKVIYPADPVTENNVNLQVAKTDTQVLVNCVLQNNVDAKTFGISTDGKVSTFFDKNNPAFVFVVGDPLQVSSSSFMAQDAYAKEISKQNSSDSSKSLVAEPGYFVHKDQKKGFGLMVPNGFTFVDDYLLKSPMVLFSAKQEEGSKYPTTVIVMKTKAEQSVSELVNFEISGNGVAILKEYTVTKNGRTLKILETPTISEEGVSVVVMSAYTYRKDDYDYVVLATLPRDEWAKNREKYLKVITSFEFLK